jgi:ABC-2 type transport system permease protein
VSGRIRAVLRKELREFRRNKLVIGSMIALPLFFLVIPTLALIGIAPDASASVVRTAVGGQLLTQYLIPLILPTIIAGSAVIGERDQGTLEPVLTTPVRHEELLLGKALAAVIPTVGMAYAMFAIFTLVVRAAAAPAVVHELWKPGRMVSVILLDPLLAVFSIWVGLAISVRSSDVRVAQQLSALAVLPMFGLLALISLGVLTPSLALALEGAAFLIVIDFLGYRIVSGLFSRERLLSRYGK